VPHRNTVHKRAIITIEIDQLKRAIGPGYLAVFPRNMGIGKAENVGDVPADGYRIITDWYHLSLGWTGKNDHSGRHAGPRASSVAELLELWLV
jgi:hypothetical protein